MRPRRVLLAAALALLLAGIAALVLLPGGGHDRGSAPTSTTSGERAPSTPSSIAPPSSAPPPSGTSAATPADGELEVLVTAAAAPRPGAEVKLYRRLAVEPGTGRPGWALDATATTGGDGRARLPAAPGAYLVAVRAPGFPTGHAAVARASGERLTSVEVVLAPGVRLSGRVVERGRGEGVPLAEVSLARRPSDVVRRGVPEVPPPERVFAVARPDGRFDAGPVAPGSYVVEAAAPGHARARVLAAAPSRDVTLHLSAAGVIEGFVFDGAGAPAAGAEVTAAGGNDLARATAGSSGGFSLEVAPGTYALGARRAGAAGAHAPVSVAAGATVRGIVLRLGASAAVTGAVTVREGAPVAGASVGLSPHGAGGEFERATTGPDGRFAFEGLAPGRYDLDVTAEGYTSAVRTGLAVLPGERFEVALALDGTGAVEGKVTGPDGAPAAGVRVRAGRRLGAPAGNVDAEARTGPDGRYRVTGLERGPSEVVASQEGGPPAASAAVDVAPGEVAHADLVLAPSGALEGEVRGEDGAPPRAATVVLQPARPGVGSLAAVRLPVGADGRYGGEVPAGDWRAVAAPAAAGAGRTASRSQAVPVRIAAGATARLDLVLRLAPEPAADAPVATVVEPGGAPCPGALVVATSQERMIAAAYADEDGRAVLERLPGDRTGLAVRARQGGRSGGPVPLAPAVTVVLQPGAALAGRVVGRGGAPVAGFSLELTPTLDEALGFGAPVRLEFAGDRFEVPDAPLGPVRVVARTPDGRRGEAVAEVVEGGGAELTVPLDPGAELRGRAVDARGAALAGALVALTGPDARPVVVPNATGGDGRFRLGALAPGRRTLRLSAPGLEPAERAVELRPGEAIDVGDVPLRPPRAP
jgi:hypothetical protein